MNKFIKLLLVVFLFFVTTITVVNNKVEAILTAPTPINVVFTDPILQQEISRLTSVAVTDNVTQDKLDLISYVTANGAASLEGLQYVRNLVDLTSFGGSVSDLTPLKDLDKLQVARLFNNKITDISALANKPKLIGVALSFNGISDISPLATCPNLTDVEVAYNKVTDISPLTNLTKLNYFNGDSNTISDISPLANKPLLNQVILTSNQVSDISSLAASTKMDILYLKGNLITNIDVLSNMDLLRKVDISGNQIVDVTPLANKLSLLYLSMDANLIENIDQIVATCPNIKILDARGNKISDLSNIIDKLRNIDSDLYGQKLDPLPVCKVNPKMTEVRCDSINIFGPSGTTTVPTTLTVSAVRQPGIQPPEVSYDETTGQTVWRTFEATGSKEYFFYVAYNNYTSAGHISNFPGLYSARVTQTFANAYTITYNMGTGTGTAPTDTNYYLPTENVTVLDGTTLSNPGNTFLGWSTDQNATVAEFTPGQTINITSDTVVYAIWAPITAAKFTITYHANTGVGTVPIDTTQYNLSDVVNILHHGNLVKNNHQFLGWSTNPNATIAEHFAGTQLTINGNIDLYAVWKADPVTIPPQLPKTGTQDILVLTTLIAFAMYGSRKFIK